MKGQTLYQEEFKIIPPPDISMVDRYGYIIGSTTGLANSKKINAWLEGELDRSIDRILEVLPDLIIVGSYSEQLPKFVNSPAELQEWLEMRVEARNAIGLSRNIKPN
jgi:hypothetical protein